MIVPFISIVFGINPVVLSFDLILASTIYFVALNAVQVGAGVVQYKTSPLHGPVVLCRLACAHTTSVTHTFLMPTFSAPALALQCSCTASVLRA